MKFPHRCKVKSLISSRYRDGVRPPNWDQRVAGVDVIETCDGAVLKLQSDGGQSPPKKSWEIILTKGNSDEGYNWTLYGIS